ncbi:MAG: TetR/AcrR family transcriptional regulator [Alphaproteobacteria bacterium]|nr:TetR/AcrR family transcriptional regulator [Alphaproteobacteria bacterium]
MPWDKQFDKTAVLEKVLGAFWSRGYEATSIQDLVDCTGVNRASLYATYGDKRQLFLAALESYDESRRRMLAELEATYPPREAIRQLFLSVTQGIGGGAPDRGCFITNTALELAAHDEEINVVVGEAQADVEAFLIRMLRKAKAAGEVASQLKCSQTARGLLAALIGLLVLVRSRPEKFLLHSIVEDAMRRLE